MYAFCAICSGVMIRFLYPDYQERPLKIFDCSFSVQGIGISAQVFINMSSGNNTASVSISPNFSNNNLTLNGNIVPLDQSNIFKGRSW